MAKLLYRPLGVVASVVGGVIASAVFNQIWKRFSDREEAPKAKEGQYGWREITPAAALQGAVFGAVKAAVDRGGLKGFEKLTGTWAGD